MRIYPFIILFFFIINCSSNKVTNYHGIKSLESKFNKIQVNFTNKNDLIDLIGPPSSISDFNKNKWFYFENLKTNQSLFKLGNKKMVKNNVLIVELNQKGLIVNKQIFDINNMNDLKYLQASTEKEFKQDNFVYNLFSSLREKINAPSKKRRK